MSQDQRIARKNNWEQGSRSISLSALPKTIVALLIAPILLSCKEASGPAPTPIVPGAVLKWEITDSKGKVVGHGERNYAKEDFNPQSRRQSPTMGNTLELSDNFVLEHPDSLGSAESGFGLVVSREDQQTFSWEWFIVDSPTHATKLQETGELAVVLEKGELIRTEFLTDVSFRVIRFPGNADPRKPDWRVRITKGSYINWPTKL